MPVIRVGKNDFSGGVASDVVNSDSTLLHGRDVFVDRSGELRFRGGKRALAIRAFVGTPVEVVGWVHAANDQTIGVVPIGETSPGDYSVWRFVGGSDPLELTEIPLPDNGQYAFVGCNVLSGNEEETYLLHDGAQRRVVKWGFSVQPGYSTGTVSLTSGSKTVTGSGTSWLANVEPGMYLDVDNASMLRSCRIKTVDTDTSLTIDVESPVTAATQDYVAAPTAYVVTTANSWGSGASYTYASPYTDLCSHKGRVFAIGILDLATGDVDHSAFRWSATPNETSGIYLGPEHWEPNAKGTVYPGVGGDLTGALSSNNELVLFKQSAMFALRGDVATDGTDLGASVDIISTSVGCRMRGSMTTSPIGVVFANLDGLYVYDGSGPPRNILTGRLRRFWREDIVAEGLDEGYTPTVSSIGERIIVQREESSGGTLVYDIPTNTFSTQLTNSTTNVVRIFDAASGDFFADVGFASIGDTTIPIDWSGDLTCDYHSDGDRLWTTRTPQPELVTPPMRLSKDGLDVGRPIRGYVNGGVGYPALFPTDGVVGSVFTLDETTGLTFNDSSSVNNDGSWLGTWSGSTVELTTDDTALGLAGDVAPRLRSASSRYGKVADNAAYRGSSSLWLECVVKPSTLASNMAFLSTISGAANTGVKVWWDASSQTVKISYGTGATVTTVNTGLPLSTSAWKHVAVIVDADQYLHYLVGETLVSGTSPITFSDGSSGLWIGQSGADTQYMDGSIDNVMIGETTLTSAQVQRLFDRNAMYNEGLARLSVSAELGAVGHNAGAYSGQGASEYTIAATEDGEDTVRSVMLAGVPAVASTRLRVSCAGVYSEGTIYALGCDAEVEAVVDV